MNKPPNDERDHIQQNINMEDGTVIGEQTNVFQQFLSRIWTPPIMIGLVLLIVITISVIVLILPDNIRGELFSKFLLPTLTPAPTPLEGAPARDGEIVVVVAQFEKTSGAEYTPEIDMLEVLRQAAAAEVGNTRVIPIGYAIHSQEEAQRVSDIYKATMVVYGRTAPVA